MEGAPELPTPLLRAVQGLSDGVGRLVLITGPPNSGKSVTLDRLRGRLAATGARVIDLQGTYHDREVPFASVAPLGRAEPPADSSDPTEGSALPVPIAALGAMADEGGRSRRSRGERQRGSVLGVQYSVRTRGGTTMDAAEYWQRCCSEFREEGTTPLAILVEDGSLVDAESRDFLLYLGERVRFRPLLIVVVLDVGEPAYSTWEERVLGRSDVDWVRQTTIRGDPREAHRLKQSFDGLPSETQRVLGFTSLLGGSTTEVTLSRVTRLNFGPLANALLPATEAHLVRVEGGKVIVPHSEWTLLIREFMPSRQVREMHREIAEALEAMSPEPTLARRVELAEHYYHWEAGPTALRYLLEAAELTERLTAYDAVIGLLDEAIQCIPSLPESDRPAAEVELRLFRTRALFFTGRMSEGEHELHAAVTVALDHQVGSEQLEEWLEPLIPVLAVIGPRPSLLQELGELADRFHDAQLVLPEVLFQSIIAGHEHRRGSHERARRESYRAGQLARAINPGPVQALALLAVGTARMDGTPEEQQLADKFLKTAHQMLGTFRRYGLQQLAEEVRSRGLVRDGDREAALSAHLRAVTVLQRMRLHSLELAHQLSIAELVLDARGADERVSKALRRSREIIDLLHLVPPSPGVLRLWLLEGRAQALLPNVEGARDRFSAVADRAIGTVPPPVRRDATLRLARLEISEQHDEVARRYFDGLSAADFPTGRMPSWDEWRHSRDVEPGSPGRSKGSRRGNR